MIRGLRAAVALPKFRLTCSPAGLNCAVVLMADQLTWLNTLYISQRNWIRRPPPIWKFLKADRFVFTIGGSRKKVTGALPMSPRPVRRLNADGVQVAAGVRPASGSQLPLADRVSDDPRPRAAVSAGEVEVVGRGGAGRAGPVAAHDRRVAGHLPAVEQPARQQVVPETAPVRHVPRVVDDEVVPLGRAGGTLVPRRSPAAACCSSCRR